jgi:hypothetical protein
MIRHISQFRMEPQPTGGKTLEENIAALEAFLNALPEQEKSIVGCHVAHSVTQAPELPDEAPVMFTQVVQMIDFLTPEDAAAYPASAAHQALVEFSQGMVKKVVAIDFEI